MLPYGDPNETSPFLDAANFATVAILASSWEVQRSAALITETQSEISDSLGAANCAPVDPLVSSRIIQRKAASRERKRDLALPGC